MTVSRRIEELLATCATPETVRDAIADEWAARIEALVSVRRTTDSETGADRG